METLQGRVEHARHTTHESGNSARPITHHVAVFEIAGVTVTWRGIEPVRVEPGDEVRVVGTPGDGERTLRALGYRNLSRGVSDDTLGGPGCARGVAMIAGCGLAGLLGAALIAGVSAVAALRQAVPRWVWMAAAALLVLAVLDDLRRSVRRRQVLALLDSGGPAVADE